MISGMVELSLTDRPDSAARDTADHEAITAALVTELDRAHGVFTPSDVDLLLRDGLCGVPQISDAEQRERFLIAFLNDHRRVIALDGADDDEEPYFSTSAFAARENALPVHAESLIGLDSAPYEAEALDRLIATDFEAFIEKKRASTVKRRLSYEARRNPGLKADEAAWAPFAADIEAEERAAYDVTAQEFRAFARQALGPGGLCIVSGPPGSKKSALVEALAQFYLASPLGQEAGFIAAAPGADQATALREDVKGPVLTLPEILTRFRDGDPPLGRGGLIALDEAGMVGSRDMEALFRHCAENQVRLVLFGDHRQLPSAEPGFPMLDMMRRFPDRVVALSSVFRQYDPRHRQATQDMRAGKARDAYAVYQGEDYAVAEGETDPAIEDAADWPVGFNDTIDRAADKLAALCIEQLGTDDDNLGITQSEDAADAVNRAVHDKLLAAGVLKKPISLDTLVGRRDFAKGEAVVLRQHLVYKTKKGRFRTLPAGTRGTVTKTRDGTLEVAYDAKKNPTLRHQAEDLPALDYGYATSLYAFQGGKRECIVDITTQKTNLPEKLVGVSRHTARLYAVTDAGVYRDLDALSADAAQMPKQHSTLSLKPVAPSGKPPQAGALP